MPLNRGPIRRLEEQALLGGRTFKYSIRAATGQLSEESVDWMMKLLGEEDCLFIEPMNKYYINKKAC